MTDINTAPNDYPFHTVEKQTATLTVFTEAMSWTEIIVSATINEQGNMSVVLSCPVPVTPADMRVYADVADDWADRLHWGWREEGEAAKAARAAFTYPERDPS